MINVVNGTWLLVLVLVCLAFAACNREAGSEVRSQAFDSLAAQEPGSTDFEDSLNSSNPYLQEYSQYDMQLIRMLAESRTSLALDNELDTQVSSTFNFMLNDNGYVLPQVEMIRIQEDSLIRGVDTILPGYRYIHRQFTVPEAWRKEYRQEAYRARSGYFPDISGWLGKQPGKMNRLFPNGCVAVLGGLRNSDTNANEPTAEESAAVANPCNPCAELDWFYYDNQGQLITTSRNGMIGLATYKKTVFPAGSIKVDPFGYIRITKNDDDSELIAIFDYDGTPLELNETHPIRDLHYFRGYSRSIIGNIYIHQTDEAKDVK
jgi:hypothetical protein